MNQFCIAIDNHTKRVRATQHRPPKADQWPIPLSAKALRRDKLQVCAGCGGQHNRPPIWPDRLAGL